MVACSQPSRGVRINRGNAVVPAMKPDGPPGWLDARAAMDEAFRHRIPSVLDAKTSQSCHVEFQFEGLEDEIWNMKG